MLWLVRFAFSPIGRYILAVVAVLTILAGIYLKGRNAGKQGALEDVRKQDDRAVEKADEAGRTVDGCYRTGGVWDRTTGKCVR